MTTDGQSEQVGCPAYQEWCATTPSMTVLQFILGFVVTAIGYPIGITLIQTLYSKILGPRPQVRQGGISHHFFFNFSRFFSACLVLNFVRFPACSEPLWCPIPWVGRCAPRAARVGSPTDPRVFSLRACGWGW